MARDRSAPAKPFIPYNAVIPDPVLIPIEIKEPTRVFIDVEVLRDLFINDDKKACYLFWDPNIELPPLPIEVVIDSFLHNRIDFGPLQNHRFRIAKAKAAPHGIVRLVRTEDMHIGPGWFQAFPFQGSSEDIDRILNNQ